MTCIDDPLRVVLLREARRFVERARVLKGVERIALIGSVTTVKENPKDIDLLVTVTGAVDFQALAAIGRKLKGAGQSRSSGADVFLCNSKGDYLGRTCSYRECHPRMACRGHRCGDSAYVCDDFEVIEIPRDTALNPPVILWPRVVCRATVPADLRQTLLTPLSQSHDEAPAARQGPADDC